MIYYGEGSVDQGWRGHPRYTAMINMYFNDYWDDEFRTDAELADVATYDMLIANGGNRYYGTDFIADFEPTEDQIAGTIDANVGANTIPTDELTCNFNAAGNQFTAELDEGAILVKMSDGKWHWFYKNEVIARTLRAGIK